MTRQDKRPLPNKNKLNDSTVLSSHDVPSHDSHWYFTPPPPFSPRVPVRVTNKGKVKARLSG